MRVKDPMAKARGFPRDFVEREVFGEAITLPTGALREEMQ